MNKQKIVQLALVGLANGLLLNASALANSEPQMESNASSSFSREALYAAKCGANGCSSVAAKCGPNCASVATRDLPQGGPKLQNPAKVNASKSSDTSAYDPNSENMNYHLMTEDELLLELNDDGIKQYKSLSPEGKALAREMASASCNNTNSCRGHNACQTDSNACAGKGSCKGRGKCAFSDKNLAVRIAAEQMAQKRNQSLGGHSK